jgi:hypothetical protein
MGNGLEVMASANAAPGLADPLRSESETAGGIGIDQDVPYSGALWQR